MSNLCPCSSGARYKDCCAPFHRGLAEPPTCEALMRSRFAAFALGLGDYLVKTLSRDHEDRGIPATELARAFGRAKETQRFLGLQVLASREEGDTGEVLFHARIFERGRDRGFAELSDFVREGSAWRYAGGRLVPGARLPVDVAGLTRDAFLALVDGGGGPIT